MTTKSRYTDEPTYPPPPPALYLVGPPVYRPIEPGRGLSIAALVCGIVGTVFGLVPITYLIALACGLTAVVLGAIAWRARKGQAHLRRTMAAWGIALGVVALVFGVAGAVIVADAVNEFDREMTELENDLEG